MSCSEAQRLTTDGRLKSDPVFVRGGEEVVFTLLETPSQLRLMRLRLADGSVERLHPQATTSEFEATFAADGSAYAFVQSRGNLNLKLVIRDIRDGRDAIFDPGGGFACVRRPTFHPRAEGVAFAIPTASGQEIAAVDRAGRGRRTLTAGGLNNWPAYSPDGSRVAFCSSRDGDFDLYVVGADGTGMRRILKLSGMQARPSWSPDGRRLAFTSNQGGTASLFVVNADGTGLVQVTAGPERDDYAAWHPGGRRLVFVGERAGRHDLYLIDVPGR